MTITKAPMKLPANLASNPNLSRWAKISADGSIIVRTGKVELGQGAVTALAAIAAAELGVPFHHVRMESGDTTRTPDEAYTAGSFSIEHGGAALRHASALVRSLFAEAAARELGVEPGDITVSDGVFHRPGHNEGRSYADLADKVDLNVDASSLPAPDYLAPPDGNAEITRLDLPQKFSGAAFLQDMNPAGLAHGRVLRPPHPHAKLVFLDRDLIQEMPGVLALVVDGSFVGIAAEREEQAIKAVEVAAKSAQWFIGKQLPPFSVSNDWMADVTPAESSLLLDEAPLEGGEAGQISSVYSRPYIAHGSIGPSSALARWTDGRLKVWSHSQGVFPLRVDLAKVLGMPVDAIDVIHAHGAGCYGHNAADDVALDAALIARAIDRPVMCQWSRADELSWSPFGAAMRSKLDARVGGDGRIASWTYDVWSPPHVVRPGGATGVNLLAAYHLAEPFEPTPVRSPPQPTGSGDRNAVPIYDLPGRRITHHRLPQGPVRSSALRSLGAHLNVFAIESGMDELAETIGADPLDFRLAHLSDPRARAVLEEAARLANWQSRGAGGEGIGFGLGLARYKSVGGYCAVVAEVEVTEKVRLRAIYAATDCGRVVHTDGVRNQIEGGIVQAASWTLKEAVQWTDEGLTTQGWDTYPILGFAEIPPIHISILNQPDAPPLGAGECAAGPTAAAIGNAIAHALGIRVRNMPLTPERIETAINAS